MRILDLYHSLKPQMKLYEANLKSLYTKAINETPKLAGRGKNLIGDVRYFGLSKDGTINFKVKSQTRGGRYHYVAIECPDIIRFGDITDNGDHFNVSDFMKLLTMKGFRIHCSCESWLYYAFQYMATQGNYEVEPETRAPKRNNTTLSGSLCKHLVGVVYNIYNNRQMQESVSKDIDNYLRMLSGLDHEDYQQLNHARQIKQKNRAVKWKNKPSDFMNDYFARQAKSHSFLDDHDIKKSLRKEMNKYIRSNPNGSVDGFLRDYFQMTQKAFADDMEVPEDNITDYFDELGFSDKQAKWQEKSKQKEMPTVEEPEVDEDITDEQEDNKPNILTKDSEQRSAKSVHRHYKLQEASKVEKLPDNLTYAEACDYIREVKSKNYLEFLINKKHMGEGPIIRTAKRINQKLVDEYDMEQAEIDSHFPDKDKVAQEQRRNDKNYIIYDESEANKNNYIIEDINQGHFDNRTRHLLTATSKKNGDLAGYIQYDVYDNNECHIEMTSVQDNYKRMGIGTMLVKELQRKIGPTDLYIDSITDEGRDFWDKVSPNKEVYKISGPFDTPYYKGRITESESNKDYLTKEEAEEKYQEYLTGHIGNVQKAMELIIKHCTDNDFIQKHKEELTKIASEHDASKYEEEEYIPYLHHFYPTCPEDEQRMEEFELACKHHILNNKHHWDYWLNHETLELPDIPEDAEEYKLYCCERVADWLAMGCQKDNGDKTIWYEMNRDAIKMPQWAFDFIDYIYSKVPDDYYLSMPFTGTRGKLDEADCTVGLKFDANIDISDIWVNSKLEHTPGYVPALGYGTYLHKVKACCEQASLAKEKRFYLVSSSNFAEAYDIKSPLTNVPDDCWNDLAKLCHGVSAEGLKRLDASSLFIKLYKMGPDYTQVFMKHGINGILVTDTEGMYDELGVGPELLIYNKSLLQEVNPIEL